jgi:CheY-like chemotaxis protein
VLIVDDEPIVRIYASELAEAAGFVTLTAASAEEALEALAGPEQVRILLTDVAMPGVMDGIDLANTVQERWPAVRIVIASGHVDSQAADGEGEIAYVRKPFTAAELIAALQSAV